MSLKLQQQIKQNSEDIRNYVQDLYDWEESQHSKPKKKVQQQTEAPIRGQVDIDVKREEDEENDKNEEDLEWQKKMEQKRQKNKNLVRDANTVQDYYKAWDKFDVDQELDDFEQQEQREKQKKLDKINPYLQDKKVKAPPRSKIQIKGGRGQLMTINSLRDRGNLHFKSTEYEKAIDNYSQCLELFKTERITRDEQDLKIVILSNRAMAYLKINEYSKAEQDCTQALKLDSKHQKSLYRRGLSRRKMKKWKEALQDFQKVKELDPKNQEVLKEFNFVSNKYNKVKEEAIKKLLVNSKLESYEKTVEVQDVQENVFENDSYIDQLEEDSDRDLGELEEDQEEELNDNIDEEEFEKGKLSSDDEFDDEEVQVKQFGKLRRDSDKLSAKIVSQLAKNQQQEDEEEDDDGIKKDSKFNHLKKIDSYHKHKQTSIPDIEEQMKHDVYFRNEQEVISPNDIQKTEYDPDGVPIRGICKDHTNDQYVSLRDIDGKVIKHHEDIKEKLEVDDDNIRPEKISLGKEEDLKFGGEQIIGDEGSEHHTYKQQKKPRRSILNSESLINYQKILEQEESKEIVDENSNFSKLKDVEGKILNKSASQNLDDENQLNIDSVQKQSSISFQNIQDNNQSEDEQQKNQYNKKLKPRRSILKDSSEITSLLQSEENFNSQKLKNIDGKVVKHHENQSDEDQQDLPDSIKPFQRDRQISIKIGQTEEIEETKENTHEYRKDIKPRRSILKTSFDSPKNLQNKVKGFSLNVSTPQSKDTHTDSEDSESDDKHVSFQMIKTEVKEIPRNTQVKRKSMLELNNQHPAKSILKPKGTFAEKLRSKSMRTEKIKGLHSPAKKSPQSSASIKNQPNKFSTFGLVKEEKQQDSEDEEEEEDEIQQEKTQKQEQQKKFTIQDSKIKSSIQFMQQWANFKKQTQQQYEFLQNQIIPELLPEIFKQGMDVSVIQDIFKALKEHYTKNPQLAYQYIENVPKVKRFQINRMSMISKEKQGIQEILSSLKKDNLIDETQYKSYIKLYQI